MSQYSTAQIWMIIAILGIGTFALRYVFLGLAARKPMPEWLLRYLRYTPVAVLPGMVAPLVLWPAATDGQIEPARMLAALLTLAAGIASRNVLIAILAGFAALYLGLFVLF
ncbi:AzlD domain-containing protein [Thioclava sp. GXIMD2076]|uniref:AzlD domain-containing protein n=1 Tax=Thioclava kandeliae TaxID=3070818 RepID=A0ABV1SCU3_9RHOB